MKALIRHSTCLFFIFPALIFAAAGIEKLAGTPLLHYSFAVMGMPEWFGYFIGTCELSGAVGLLWPQTRKLAALGLAIIMVGAIFFHIKYAIQSPIPAVVLLILLLLTIGLRYPRQHKI